MLGSQVRIPAHEPRGEILKKTRLLEARAERGNRPDALGEPDGNARAIGRVGAEALIVLEPRTDRDVHRSLGARDALEIDRAVGPRSRPVESRAGHRLPLECRADGQHVTRG